MRGRIERSKEGWGIEIYQDMAGEEKGMESRVTGKWDVRATRGGGIN